MDTSFRELRCHCGSLVARLVEGKLELKCRRCQRLGLIDLARTAASADGLAIEWLPERAQAKPR
jgi:phage FluMu protein Com